MKSSNKSLYFQWFLIGVVITLVCVGLGFFVNHYLMMREEIGRRELMKERIENRLAGPIRQRLKMIQSLIHSKKFSAEEAYELVDDSQNSPFPEASYLLDKDKKIILSHVSTSYHPEKIQDFQVFQLSSTRYLRVNVDNHPGGPFHHGLPGGKRGPPRPPGFFLFGALTMASSIIIGIGLSVIALTLYLRRRARMVEKVMEKIKEGDLKARFNITQTDETGLLMGKFNEMANEIESLVQNLRDTEESRKKMLQELAHDLRTPVASLKSLQETLFNQGQFLEDDKKKLFQNLAMKEVNYFERLVENLLFLSRVDDPRYTHSFKQINLTEIIQEELELLELEKIKISFDHSKPSFIKGDTHLIHRLLKNAFSNSIRFAKSEILIKIIRDDGKLKLTIKDDGEGFSESDLLQFGDKKFSREVGEKESGHISLGLGSVIMKKIMLLHNGNLVIKNGHPGAELILSFPNL